MVRSAKFRTDIMYHICRIGLQNNINSFSMMLNCKGFSGYFQILIGARNSQWTPTLHKITIKHKPGAVTAVSSSVSLIFSNFLIVIIWTDSKWINGKIIYMCFVLQKCLFRLKGVFFLATLFECFNNSRLTCWRIAAIVSLFLAIL